MHVVGGLQNPQSCHWSDEFQKLKIFFSENRAPGFFGPLAAIQALELTLQTLLWPVIVPWSPYA